MGREKSSTSPEDSVPKLLKIIIRLLVERQISAAQMTMDDAIKLLSSMGLGPTEIGDIIGWSKGSVGSRLTRLKQVGKK